MSFDILNNVWWKTAFSVIDDMIIWKKTCPVFTSVLSQNCLFNSTGIQGLPSQRVRNAGKVSMLWRYHGLAAMTTFRSYMNTRGYSKRVIKFNGLFRPADSEIHRVHTGRVIITYTLVSLSSFASTDHIYLKKGNKTETQKSDGTPLCWYISGEGNPKAVYNGSKT